jgi:DNA-binding transcriptional LysR family regulator
LHDRKYDLYLTLLPLPEHRVPDGLNVEFLFSDPLVVAAGMNHRWANRRKIDFADFGNAPSRACRGETIRSLQELLRRAAQSY